MAQGGTRYKKKKTNNTNKKNEPRIYREGAQEAGIKGTDTKVLESNPKAQKKNLFLKREANPAHSLTGNRKTRKKLKCKLCEN